MPKELLLRDLSGHGQLDEKDYPQTVDIHDSFALSAVSSPQDSSVPNTDDIFVEENAAINLCPPRTIHLFAPQEHTSSDVHKLDAPSFKKYLFGGSKALVDPIPLDAKKKIEKPHSIDIRTPENLKPSPIRYPDIYHIPLPWHKQASKKGLILLKKGDAFRRKHASLFLAIFAILCSLSLLGIAAKNILTTKTLLAYENLQAGLVIAPQDPIAAQSQLYRTQSDFHALKAWFSPLRLLLDNPLVSVPSVHAAGQVLEAGNFLSQASAQSVDLYGQFLKEIQKPHALLKDESASGSTLSPFLLFRWTDFLKANKELVLSISQNVQSANATLADITTVGDAKKDEKLVKAKKILSQGAKILAFATDNFDELVYMAGDTRPQKYFVLNQNNDEIRASGGFPWSALYVELYKGALRSFGKKDIYEYDWNLYPYKEIPPAGLALISPNHGLRDANYFPEFEKNAQKMNFFIEKAGFSSIDTFIAINQKLVTSFLQEYGPVYFQEINETISAQNFSLIFSTLVESKVFLDTQSTDWKKTPKSILFSFIDVFLAHLVEKKDFAGYAKIVEDAFMDREIQIASLDSQIQEFLQAQNIVDPWLTNKGNWVYPVFTSVSGNKSDRYIDRTITLKSTPQLGWKIQNKFTLEMLHTFGDAEINQLNALYKRYNVPKKEQYQLTQIQGAGPNRAFVRVLAPKGSKLIKDDGGTKIEVDDSEAAYTMFTFNVETTYQNRSSVSFIYESAPQDLLGDITFYRQPGLGNLVVHR